MFDLAQIIVTVFINPIISMMTGLMKIIYTKSLIFHFDFTTPKGSPNRQLRRNAWLGREFVDTNMYIYQEKMIFIYSDRTLSRTLIGQKPMHY